MHTCQDVQAQAGAWIDGEVDAVAREAIGAHVARCEACAREVDAQRVTRTLVGAHAAELRGVAPAGLRDAVIRRLDRTADVVAFPEPRPSNLSRAQTRWSTRVVRWAVAATLLLAVGGLAAGRGGRLFAAQLALDHYKCLLIDGGHPDASANGLETSWRETRGWPIAVPPSDETAGVRLVGLRLCLAGKGRMAHVLYEAGGERLSLFILPEAVDDVAADLPIMGVGTHTWSRDGRTYALVGARAMASDRVVAYMQAHAH